MDELKKILKGLGVKAEHIETLMGSDEDAKKAIKSEDVVKDAKQRLSDTLMNDSAFIDPIEQRMRGKVLSSKERKLMKLFGIDQEAFDALPDENKFDALMELAHKKANEGKKEPSEAAKEIEKLQTLIKEREKAIKELNEIEIPRIKGEVTSALQGMKIQNRVSGAVSKRELIVKPEFAISSVLSELSSRYDLQMNEAGDVVLKQKGKDLEVFVDNEKLSLEKAIDSIVEDAGIVRKNNGDGGSEGGGGSRKKIEDKDSGKNLPPGLEKARERAKELAAEASKTKK